MKTFAGRVRLFTQLNEQLQSQNARALSDFVGSIAQFNVLQLKIISVIMRFDHCKMSDLARALQVTQGYITQSIDALEQQKMVQRKRSDEDRRVVYVALTSKGKKLADQHSEVTTNICCDLLSKLDEQEQIALLNIMAKFIR